MWFIQPVLPFDTQIDKVSCICNGAGHGSVKSAIGLDDANKESAYIYQDRRYQQPDEPLVQPGFPNIYSHPTKLNRLSFLLSHSQVKILEIPNPVIQPVMAPANVSKGKCLPT